MNTMILFFVFSLGAIIGSFLNVCIVRLPKRESLIRPSSHCPHCNEPIRFYDNIPIISYIHLAGKCRHCNKRISLRYPIVEGLTGLMTVALFMRYGPSVQFLLLLLFSAALLIITFIDLDHQIIPDVVSIPGIPCGVAASLLIPTISWLDSLLGILVGGGLLLLIAVGYKWITGREGMGGGDIKLLAMMGAWLGWKAIPFILLASSLIGILIGGGSGLVLKKGLKTKIPFGPFLSISSIIYIFFGPELIKWYIAWQLSA
ncbi:MAG: prepilin peptidase [Deltaproteobacteria bacterium]|nr:MAG: prepilin peptidase [Deltaproteobacteria bacterium]